MSFTKENIFPPKLTCGSCHKEINDKEKIAIIVEEKDLKGFTSLRGWANNQKKVCFKCFKN